MFKKLLLLVMVLLMLLLLVVYPALHKAAGLPGRLPNAGPGIHCERSVASSRACVTLLSDYESELPRLCIPVSLPNSCLLPPPWSRFSLLSCTRAAVVCPQLQLTCGFVMHTLTAAKRSSQTIPMTCLCVESPSSCEIHEHETFMYQRDSQRYKENCVVKKGGKFRKTK